MKTKFIVFAILATMAMARISENYSSVKPQPRHWTNIPEGLIDYFVAIDLWLVGILWKYIMYGTWYVLGEQIYCNFSSLKSILPRRYKCSHDLLLIRFRSQFLKRLYGFCLSQVFFVFLLLLSLIQAVKSVTFR